jgi:hypothetical protein
MRRRLRARIGGCQRLVRRRLDQTLADPSPTSSSACGSDTGAGPTEASPSMAKRRFEKVTYAFRSSPVHRNTRACSPSVRVSDYTGNCLTRLSEGAAATVSVMPS